MVKFGSVSQEKINYEIIYVELRVERLILTYTYCTGNGLLHGRGDAKDAVS